MFRTLNGVFAVLFALAATVQYNDPDPFRWIVVYALAAILSARVAWGRPIYVPGALALSLATWIWALLLLQRANARPNLDGLLEFRTMRTADVEIAREFLGLAMVSGWMLVHVVRGWTRRAG